MSKATDELNWKGEPRKRKKKSNVDLEDLKRLARLHLTNTEIAEWFDININTLLRSPYRKIIADAKSETKQRLKQKALQRGLVENSDTLLIFCLKNYCGWNNNDKQETIVDTKKNGGFTIKVLNTKEDTKE